MNVRAESFWRSAVLVGIALAFTLWFWPAFLTHWDSYLYTTAALRFEPVPLAGGRWFFALIYGSTWQLFKPLFGNDPARAWQLFSGLSAALSAVNVVLIYRLGRRLVPAESAFLAAVIWAASPLVSIYSSAVMTEPLTVTFLLLCLLLLIPPKNRDSYLFSRGRYDIRLPMLSAIGGILMGLAINVREPMIFFLPAGVALILTSSGDSAGPVKTVKVLATLAFLALAAAVILAGLYLAGRFGGPQWQDIQHAWQEGMLREREWLASETATMLLRNCCYLVVWAAMVSPVIILMLSMSIRTPKSRELKILLACTGLYALAQVANHSLIFNPRFALFIGLVLIFPIAQAITARRSTRLPAALPAVVIIGFHLACIVAGYSIVRTYHFDRALKARELSAALHHLPDNCTIAPGNFSALIEYHVRLNDRRDWQIIYSGWEWPRGRLVQIVQNAIDNGREVFIVDHPPAWRCAFRRYEGEEVEKLREHFTFRQGPASLARISAKSNP